MFTDIFGSAPRVRLIDFLADHPAFDYTISQMAEFAEIARPTVYELVDELVGQEMLTFTRLVGDSKFYRLNVANPDRKSTRLNSQSPCNLVCRLLLEKKKTPS